MKFRVVGESKILLNPLKIKGSLSHTGLKEEEWRL